MSYPVPSSWFEKHMRWSSETAFLWALSSRRIKSKDVLRAIHNLYLSQWFGFRGESETPPHFSPSRFFLLHKLSSLLLASHSCLTPSGLLFSLTVHVCLSVSAFPRFPPPDSCGCC